MRVSARGYKRDSGSRTIFDEGVVDAITEQDGTAMAHYENTLYLQKNKSDGSITLHISPIELSGFGGDYRLFVHLTQDEIAQLFLECFPDTRDVIARVATRPPAKPRSTTQLHGENPALSIEL